jgi:uncharacterized protein YjbI with pentapeptide repeats
MDNENRRRDSVDTQTLLRRNGRARDFILKGADLRGRDLAGLRADGLDLEDADLRESSLTGSKWKGCILRDARLDSADLSGAVLRVCDLDQARLSNAILVRTRLENSTARGSRFNGADLTGATLIDTDFSRASLRGAKLTGVSASGAIFRGADLSGANLRDAILTDADLRGADLTNADLQGADLSGADLRGVLGDHPALQRTDDPWGDLPPEIRDLSETMTPVVIEVLRTAGRRGAIDAKTTEHLMAQTARHQRTSPGNALSPDTLAAVSQILDELGENVLPALVGALQQPTGEEPPPEVQALILRLRDVFGLDETATAEDVLARLIHGSGPSFPSA